MTSLEQYRNRRRDVLLITLALVWTTMKWYGVIHWPWWLVLGPLYIPALAYIVFWGIVLLWIRATMKR